MATPPLDVLGKFRNRYVNYLTVTPLLVAAAIIAASAVVAVLIQRNLTTLKTQAIEKRLKENELLIQNKFNAYAQVVWSSAGLLNTTQVDRDAWARFVATLQLPARYPALYSLGATRIIMPGEQTALLQRLSKEFGQPLRVIKGTNEQMNIAMYAQPERVTTINNIGLNLYSDESRRQAMQAATDKNDITMTEQVQLITNARQGTTSDGPAFLMYAPYYKRGLPTDTVEQRRAAALGHVSASFRTQTVFARTFENVDFNKLSVQVYMGDEHSDRLAFASTPAKTAAQSVSQTQQLTIFGQQFTIRYKFDNDYLVPPSQLRSPLLTVLLGTVIGVLLGTVTFFFLRGRHHELLLDKERDITRAKDELLSLASHQLRTPATGVKQYLGMVLQGFAGSVKSHQRQLLEKAYKSNERQLNVINDVLHLAKLDLGRIVLAKTTFQLGDLLQDVLDEQQHDLQAAGLVLKVQNIASAPVYADQHMLRMVIENIISNAIKYTDPGGHIWARLRRVKGGYAVTVRDTGVGIAQADMPRLFQQFSRIANSRSHLVPGTGVGLYLSKHLMLLHGGDITVQSVPGTGSTFTVFVPIADEKL